MNICSKTESEIENQTKKSDPKTESKENLNWQNIDLYYPTTEGAVYGWNGTLQEKLREFSKKNQLEFIGLAYHAADPYK
jgi:hypothetical protein